MVSNYLLNSKETPVGQWCCMVNIGQGYAKKKIK